ncbi:MAG TPA: thioredoxin family protein [Gaiellaceae bacterium]|jgi:thioredoxin-like negative regulator of GroEL
MANAAREQVEQAGYPEPDEAVEGRPQLVFFYSRTSGLCRRVDGYLGQILQRHRNHRTFKLIRVPIEDHAPLVELFGIDVVPTLVVVHERKVCARIDAPSGRPEIERTLAPWLR